MNENSHRHRGGDRDFSLRAFGLAHRERAKIMTHLLGPIALVSYVVAAITGSCFAILFAALWCALDKLVTRLAIRARNRRSRARTVVRIGREDRTY